MAEAPDTIATDGNGDGTPAGMDGPFANPSLASAQPLSAVSRAKTQQRLIELWEKLLDVPAVDGSDNFFDLGGHSLLAARAVSEIERTFGARIPLKTLMVSSLNQVASEIDRVAAGPAAPGEPKVAERGAQSSSETHNVGRLASWFKNRLKGDRSQDG